MDIISARKERSVTLVKVVAGVMPRNIAVTGITITTIITMLVLFNGEIVTEWAL